MSPCMHVVKPLMGNGPHALIYYGMCRHRDSYLRSVVVVVGGGGGEV